MHEDLTNPLTDSSYSEQSNLWGSMQISCLENDAGIYATCINKLSDEGETSIDEVLWKESFTRSRWVMLMYLVQAFAFISNNVAVNWYSLDKNWRGKLDPNIIFSFNVLFALGTIFSNIFSKVIELVDETDGLKLDVQQSACFAMLKDGPQKTFIKNIYDRLTEYTFADPKYEYVLILRPSDLGLFIPVDNANFLASPPAEQRGLDPILWINQVLSEPLANSLRFIKKVFLKKTKKNLKILFADNTQQNEHLLKHCEQNPGIHPILIATGELGDFLQTAPKQYTLIRVYTQGWTGRMVNALTHREFRTFVVTLGKALLAQQRWMLSKGLPGLVVLATGIVSFSYIFKAQQLDEPISQAAMFSLITALSWVGKVHINNRLKGDAIDIELRRLVERLAHQQSICPRLNLKVALPIILVSLSSVIPYNVTTAWFYTASGIDTALNQFNRFTNLNLTLPGTLATLTTYLAIIASIPIAVATNSKPAYNLLMASRTPQDPKTSPAESDASKTDVTTQYRLLWRIFLLATLLDGVKCGDNAIRNAKGTLDDLVGKYPSLDDFSKTGWATALIAEISVFNALFNIVFSIDRALPKFSGTMLTVRHMHQPIAKLFQSKLNPNDFHTLTEIPLSDPLLPPQSELANTERNPYFNNELARASFGTSL